MGHGVGIKCCSFANRFEVYAKTYGPVRFGDQYYRVAPCAGGWLNDVHPQHVRDFFVYHLPLFPQHRTMVGSHYMAWWGVNNVPNCCGLSEGSVEEDSELGQKLIQMTLLPRR